MTVTTRVGAVQRARSSSRRITRGYASSRQSYDARRRRSSKTTWDLQFKAMVQRDPCAYCGGPGSDHDHIVGLRAGGEDGWENFTGACKRCNASKREQPLLLWMLTRG